MQLPRFSWRLIITLIIAAGCGFFLILSASYLYLGPKLPPASQITQVQFQTPLRIYTRDKDLMAEFGKKRRIPQTFKQFPPNFIHAILAAEDAQFFQHGAVDYKGLARAVYELVRYRHIRSGGSTITMQVARNFFLTLNQTFLRKFNEIVLAIQIENLLTKQQILTLYLNKIYLGHHAYGAAAAAQIYYGKPLDQLTLAQMAMLAGLPKAPSSHNPIDGPKAAIDRRNWILGRMKQLGDISEFQYQLAAAQPVTASYHGINPDVEASYAAELARRQVLDLIGKEAYTSGISVITTLSSQRQAAAIKAMRQGLQDYDKRHGWRGPLDHLDISSLPELPSTSQSDAKAGNLLPVSSSSRVWAKKLADYPAVANLRIALVGRVSKKNALVVLRNAREVQLGWNAMKWANPYKTANYRGHAPTRANQVIKPGDVIYLLPVQRKDGPGWRVAEIPTIQGGLISLDPNTGAIQAMQGGYSFQLSHYNRATQARRQPGSAFKPFIYTAALASGMTPATLLNDAPLVFNDKKLETTWRPTGDTRKFYGPTRLRVALYRSLNLASIRLLQRIGMNKAFATLKQFHLPVSRFPKNLSIVLGTVSLSPMQMATAYSIFANGGYHVRPWLIERITDSKGQTLWQAPKVVLCDGRTPITAVDEKATKIPQQCPSESSRPDISETIDSGYQMAPLKAENDPKSVPPAYRYRTLDKRVDWLMYSILKSVITKGTGVRARKLHYPSLAGKTGTTNKQKDAWFNGFSPDLVASVWTGFDQPAPLGRYEQGAHTALPIWIDYMRDALPYDPQHHFREPAGISAVLINKKTGKRAHPGDDNTMFEYFRSENIPPFGKTDSSNKAVAPQGLF